MIKRLTLIVMVLSFTASGCLVFVPRTGKHSSCPPGKTWSDGSCHKKGKGHDPDKHKKKKNKKHKKNKKNK